MPGLMFMKRPVRYVTLFVVLALGVVAQAPAGAQSNDDLARQVRETERAFARSIGFARSATVQPVSDDRATEFSHRATILRVRTVFSQRVSGPIRALTLGLIVSSLACSGGSSGSSPTQPSSTSPSSVTGTWTGTADDSSGPGQMTWQITQSGSSFSGTLTLTLRTATNTTVTARGTASGTVSGASIQFSMAVLAGGFDSPFESCAVNVSGSGSVTSTAITGTYAGSSSCGGGISSGQLTLNKQ